MTPLAATLPEHSNDGYVAAAYIVFLALVLVYVAIMAVRLGRVQRQVEEMRRDAEEGGFARARDANPLKDPHPQTFHPQPQDQERERV